MSISNARHVKQMQNKFLLGNSQNIIKERAKPLSTAKSFNSGGNNFNTISSPELEYPFTSKKFLSFLQEKQMQKEI